MLVGVEIRGPSDEAGDKIDPIAARAGELQEGTPRSTSDRLARAPRRRSWVLQDDLKKAGLYSIPLTLIILMLAFGALVAAGIPLLLGITAVLPRSGWSPSSARCSRWTTPCRQSSF